MGKNRYNDDTNNDTPARLAEKNSEDQKRAWWTYMSQEQMIRVRIPPGCKGFTEYTCSIAAE
jgi:hypothetical protein